MKNEATVKVNTKLSEFILSLQEFQSVHGDTPVAFFASTSDMPQEKLGAPCFCIALGYVPHPKTGEMFCILQGVVLVDR